MGDQPEPASSQRGGRDQPSPDRRAFWLRRAFQLLLLTVLYNGVEAMLALWAGIRAGSIALVGFGLDSVIEMAAAGVVLRRVGLERGGRGAEDVERLERRVRRFVGVTFFLLAAYVVAQAGWSLWTAAVPEESPLGIIIAVLSLIVMPALAWGKLRAARHVGSRSLEAEAKETLACAWLSLALLLGLVGNAALGWWWADPVAALLMVPWVLYEGKEAFEEEEWES